MALRVQELRVRVGTAAEQGATLLPAGMFGRATDTGHVKIGDGATAWGALDVLQTDAVV